MGLKIVALVGSVRSDRQGIKAARFVEWTLAARGHEVTVVDPVVLQLPLLDSSAIRPEPRRRSRRDCSQVDRAGFSRIRACACGCTAGGA
jgi:NAD(P)H-dependent FMN reductase